MDDEKLTEIETELDDAALSTEELAETGGSLSREKIDSLKNAIDKAEEAAEDLEDPGE